MSYLPKASRKACFHWSKSLEVRGDNSPLQKLRIGAKQSTIQNFAASSVLSANGN